MPRDLLQTSKKRGRPSLPFEQRKMKNNGSSPKRQSREWLRPRELIFIKEFACTGGNRKAASIAAGYAPTSNIGSYILMRPRAQAELQRQRELFFSAYDVSVQRVLGEIATQAFYDPAAFYDKNGRLKSIKRMSVEVRHALHLEEVRLGGKKVRTTIRGANRAPALELLVKILGMAVPNQLDVNLNGLISIEAARALAADFERQGRQRNGEPVSEPSAAPPSGSEASE